MFVQSNFINGSHILKFNPDIQYWLNETSTFRVVFIQVDRLLG